MAFYGSVFGQGQQIRTELYIDFTDDQAVDELFEQLAARKEPIEDVYGGVLSWEELPDKRASRVADYTSGDITNRDGWDSYIDWFFDTGQRLRQAINEAAADMDWQR